MSTLILKLDTPHGPLRVKAPIGDGDGSVPNAVTILSVGEKKILCIKEIRAFSGLGLKEAKEASESLPRQFFAADLKGSRAIGFPSPFADFAEAINAAGGSATIGYIPDDSRESVLIREILAAVIRAV